MDLFLKKKVSLTHKLPTCYKSKGGKKGIV